MGTESPNWVYGTKSSFAAGELTPTIEGRTDLPLYQNGAKKMVNWLVLPSSGVIRRPGTEFIWAQTVVPEVDKADGSVSVSDTSGSTSSGSGDDLPPIALDEELTYATTAQDSTSRLYRMNKNREERERFFDYGILDEEDAVYFASQEEAIHRNAPEGQEQ